MIAPILKRLEKKCGLCKPRTETGIKSGSQKPYINKILLNRKPIRPILGKLLNKSFKTFSFHKQR